MGTSGWDFNSSPFIRSDDVRWPVIYFILFFSCLLCLYMMCVGRFSDSSDFVLLTSPAQRFVRTLGICPYVGIFVTVYLQVCLSELQRLVWVTVHTCMQEEVLYSLKPRSALCYYYVLCFHSLLTLKVYVYVAV